MMRKMQTKTEIPFHNHLVAIVKKTITTVHKDVPKSEPLYTTGGNVKILYSLWKIVWKLLNDIM